MTTYNTGNPIGSTDARDRLDNSENMDILENSTTLNAHPDRLGTMRKTRKGMELEHDNQIAAHETEHDNQIAAHETEHDNQIAAHETEHDNQMQSFENDFDSRLAGMAFTRVGTFTAGATLTDMRQTMLWEVSQGGDGHEYGWTGSFSPAGKVVPAGSTPATSGGVGAGAWVDRTNETLRSELNSIGGASQVKSVDGLTVQQHVDLASDSYPTIKAAIDATLAHPVTNKIYEVASFYGGWATDSIANYLPAGGGRFIYDPNMPKSKHDGGTIISPTVPFDGTHAGVAAWLSATGETIPAGNGCLVRLDIKELNLLWFGSTRTHPDDNTAPINKFKSVWNHGKIAGYIPFGEYRTTDRFLVDCSLFSGRNIQPLRGDGPGLSRLFSDSAVGPVFHWYGGNASIFDHFQGKIDNLELIADCPTGATFTIGKSDFSDSQGNYNVKNILVRNVNTLLSDGATTIELNYLFDCVFENVVAVGNVNHGAALKLRQTRFSNFIGGSYSNAKWGIVFDGGVSDCNTFISLDIENVTFGISSFSAWAGANHFIGGYMDIWNPNAMAFPSGGYALNIQQCNPNKFTIDGMMFTRLETYPYTGTNFQQAAYSDNVILRGKYAGQTTPPMLASDAQTINHTSQTQRVRIYGGTVTDIFLDGVFTGFTKGDFTLLPGEAIAVRYSAAPTWTWTAMAN